MAKRGPKPKPIAERFWPKVDKRGPDECWPWKPSPGSHGYGIFAPVRRHATTSHRVAYMLTKGDIPDGLFIMHTCDFRPCCNPAHLVAGTQSENMIDASVKGRLKDRNTPRGEAHWKAKLSDKKVRKILELMRASKTTDTGLAKRFGVSNYAISNIRHGKAWSHIAR